MRRFLFWLGWGVLFVLPVVFVIQIFVIDDLPKVALWQWAIPIAAMVLIYLARNRDDVLKHRLV